MKKTYHDADKIILKRLKKDEGYVSGEDLANKLSISRQAIWKHIDNFINKGYEIVAVPHLGYKLISSPDKLYPLEIQHDLKTTSIGKNIFYEHISNSTQDSIWKLGLDGGQEGTVVFSESQRKGRGRMDRAWISPKGGIYFSLLLKPKFLQIQEVPQITLMISLACLKAIKKATGVECQLKWPNDIFLNKKKLGGILCEIHAETDKVHFVVVGIGINVNSRDLPKTATSLFLSTKNKFSRVEIAKRVLEEIETQYKRIKDDGFKDVLKEWSQACFLWGKKIKVKIFDKQISGQALSIDKRGYLLIKRDHGSIEKISAGDIIKINF